MNDRETKPSTGSGVTPDISHLDISQKTFKEFADAAVKSAIDAGIGTESLMPVVLVYYREIDGERGMLSDIKIAFFAIGADFSDSKEKRALMFNIGVEMFNKQGLPAAVFMASEAWVVVRNTMDEMNGKMPSQCDDKKEVFIVVGKSPGGEDSAQIMIPVKRDAENKFVQDGEPDRADKGTMPLLDCFFIGFQYASVDKFRTTLPKDIVEQVDSFCKRHGFDEVFKNRNKTFKTEDLNNGTDPEPPLPSE